MEKEFDFDGYSPGFARDLSNFANFIEDKYKIGQVPEISVSDGKYGVAILASFNEDHYVLETGNQYCPRMGKDGSALTCVDGGKEFAQELINAISKLCEPLVAKENWNLFLVEHICTKAMETGICVGVQTNFYTETVTVSVNVKTLTLSVEGYSKEDDGFLSTGDVDWALMAAHGAETMQFTSGALNDVAHILAMSSQPNFKWGLLELDGGEAVIVAGTPGEEVALMTQAQRFPKIDRPSVDTVSYGDDQDRMQKRADHGLDVTMKKGEVQGCKKVRAIRNECPVHSEDTGHYDPSIDGGNI
jgi:hypothetical protein